MNAEREAVSTRVRALMAARQLDRDLAAGMEGPDLRPLRVESPVLLKAFGELEAHRARGDAPGLRRSLEA